MVDTKHAKEVTSEYMSSYSAYVATSRAIPSLMDGFKPSQRRCVLTGHDLGIFHNKKHMKTAKVGGDVIGNYHPHGGVGFAGLVQPFTIRYPLFEGQGNWGSSDMPGSCAADRYTELRLTEFCEMFYLSSIDYADREDNYDGRLKEVTLFYPSLPGVLFTGAQGIAIGLSTYIPSHDIKTIGRSLLIYLDDTSSEKFLDTVIPDTCEESIILTPLADIKKMYKEGAGSISYKAKTHYETIDGKYALVVDAFPPGYSKKRLETSTILEAVECGQLELINESKEQLRYVFMSPDLDILKSVEERLTNSVGYRFYIEHRGVLKQYPLKEIYDTFIDEKSKFIVRMYSDLSTKVQSELDYYNILILFKQDRNYIKNMVDKTSEEVINDIVTKYKTTEAIAKRILGTSIRGLLKDNHDQLLAKVNDLNSTLAEYNKYVADPLYKLKKDIYDLLNLMKYDKRRAVHVDEVMKEIGIRYRDQIINVSPDTFYYVGTSDNKVTRVRGIDLPECLDDTKCFCRDGYNYYILYDDRGFCAVTSDTMTQGSKLNSDKLIGILGADELSDIIIIDGRGKTQNLGDWGLRKRTSYIRMSDEGQKPIGVGSSKY